MKVVIAPDSFKESLSARQVADALEAGWRTVFPHAEYVKVPMADGGEGTVQSLIEATAGRMMQAEVTDPLGGKIQAVYGISGDGKTAVIEMAAASGLHLVPPARRNPLYTTSYGTGELILAALEEGVTNIILGIGGSATNDGGAGMLQALGVKLADKYGASLGYGGGSLADLEFVDLSGFDTRLAEVSIRVACDVRNPLCGEQGASAVFGPQKGATPAMVAELDSALNRFADIVRRDTNINIRDHEGAGAAGGMGGGVLLLPDVVLQSGVQIVIEALGLEEKMRDADLVLTGEGRMDGQSIRGKTPVGVALAAKKLGKPVVAVVGSIGQGYEAVYEYGIDAVFPIIRSPGGLEEALQNGYDNLLSAAANIARLYNLPR